MTLTAIVYEKGSLKILDQLLLPAKSMYIPICCVDDGWTAINKMQVRGAPAIAIVGCLSLAVDIWDKDFNNKELLHIYIQQNLDYLVTARNTAINMKKAADKIKSMLSEYMSDSSVSAQNLKQKYLSMAEKMLEDDISDNMVLSLTGAEYIIKNCSEKRINVLTHCNTGSLATAGYGTALGVIRKLHELNFLDRVYCTETRPYNQGSRLTAYELLHDKIPATLIADNTVSMLFHTKNIDAVIVGADLVAANGDTINKIGTYQIAISAKYHQIPFYVAAPLTSVDLNIPNGNQVLIEERSDRELTHIGDFKLAPPGIECWNPAFDVTPALLIKGIITEKGVLDPSLLKERIF